MLPRRSKLKTIFQLIVFLLMAGGIIAGVSQIKVVREFFSRAGGTPADIQIDTTAVLGRVPRPWRNLAQGGENHAWRMGPITSSVKALQPEYIRLDHIYDFYDIVGGSSGNLTFDWTKLDAVLSDIKATGAKPFISLSYMPPVIASGDLVSAPKNYGDWQIVVQRTIEHISGTLGIADVYYEVWNEPDLFGGWKYYGSKNYLALYSASARGAANARGVQPFKIGGPAITALYKSWVDALLSHATKENLRLDFISWHRYTNDLDQFKKDMTDAQTWLTKYPQYESVIELMITEWGHDSNNHAGYDSRYAAAHTVAGSIAMVGNLDRAFIFEIQDGKDPAEQEYWGRWGLFTAPDFGGKAKPRYTGLKMLDSLADQRLQTLGQGSFVKALAAKKSDDTVQLVLANFDPRGSNRENVPVTYHNISPGSFLVSTKYLSGPLTSVPVATTEAKLRIDVAMSPNDVALVELKRQ